jgi:phosphoribosylaminoimidazole-succinocarboxamide synthase
MVGTLDECRFTYDGLHVSKEIARIFYRKTEWSRAVEEAKKQAEAKGVSDWKSLCKVQPPKLDPELKTVLSQVYMAAANDLTGKRMFDVPALTEVLKKVKEFSRVAPPKGKGARCTA